MIKLLIATRRRPGMTQAEFRHHLKNVHAPLVMQDPDATDLIRKYTQNHVFDAAYGVAGISEYPLISERDIITELWFDSVEQMAQGQHTPMYLNVIRPDEDNFADQATVLAFPVREEEFAVPRPRTAPCKVFHYLKQAAGSSDEDFAGRWRDAHTSIMASNPEIADGVAKYLQNYALSTPQGGSEDGTRYGVATLWFDSQEYLGVFHAYHRQLAAVSAQHGNFFDPAQSFFIFTEEFEVKQIA